MMIVEAATAGMHRVHAMSRAASTCTAFTVVSPTSRRGAQNTSITLLAIHQPSIRSLRCATSFPDIEDGKSNDTNKRDCLEEGANGVPQYQVSQKDDPSCSEVEDGRSCEGDVALPTIDEDDARQKQAEDDKDREPEYLVDGVCKGRIAIDQEDRDKKGGVGHLLNDASSPCCLLF